MYDHLISRSGGGMLFSMIVGFDNAINPNISQGISNAGISSGSIYSFIKSCGKEIKAKELVGNITLNMFLKQPLFYDVLGFNIIRLSALIRFLFKGYMVEQDIPSLLRKYVTEKDFKSYQSNQDTGHCYIVAVNMSTEQAEVFDLKDKSISYDLALRIVAASCSIPLTTQPIKIGNDLYTDGGLREHNPANLVMLKYPRRFKRVWSFYTRPEKAEIEKKFELKGFFKSINVIKKVVRLLTVSVTENSEQKEKLIAKDQNISLAQFFPSERIGSTYKASTTEQLIMYDLGYKSFGNYGITSRK